MTHQEKRNIVHLITFILFMGIYALIVLNKYQSGDFDHLSDMRFWATIIIISIPIQIAVRIVVEIIYHIVIEVSSEITGKEKDDVDIVDERDKLIELKASRGSSILFAVGFIWALATQMFDASIHTFFLIIVITGVFSELLETGLKLHYYRNGV